MTELGMALAMGVDRFFAWLVHPSFIGGMSYFDICGCAAVGLLAMAAALLDSAAMTLGVFLALATYIVTLPLLLP